MTKRNSRPPNENLEAPVTDDLTPEQEERAWLLYYYQKAKDQGLLVDRAKAAAKQATDALTEIFRSAKADAKISRQELAGYVADAKLGEKTLSAQEERRIRHKSWLGQPVGSQLELPLQPLEVQDEAHAKSVGYAMGLRGDACEMPDNLQPRFASVFAEGWGKGQEELSWALSAVGRIVDRKEGAKARPVGLEPEPGADPEEVLTDGMPDPVKIEAASRKLAEENPAFGPTESEQVFEEEAA